MNAWDKIPPPTPIYVFVLDGYDDDDQRAEVAAKDECSAARMVAEKFFPANERAENIPLAAPAVLGVLKREYGRESALPENLRQLAALEIQDAWEDLLDQAVLETKWSDEDRRERQERTPYALA